MISSNYSIISKIEMSWNFCVWPGTIDLCTGKQRIVQIMKKTGTTIEKC